jgi:hypothetical protein
MILLQNGDMTGYILLLISHVPKFALHHFKEQWKHRDEDDTDYNPLQVIGKVIVKFLE